jgi:membrane protein
MTDDRGRNAATPMQMPKTGWWDALKRSWAEMGKDNLSLIAAGVAFYGFTAMVPLLGATVLVYGFVADPQTVLRQMAALTEMLPAEAASLIGEQLMNVVASNEGKKGLGLIVALAIALWGATKGAGAIVTALNIAYEEEDQRGFVKRTLLNLAIVLGAVIGLIFAVGAITSLSHLERIIPGAPAPLVWLGKVASWLALAALVAAGAATLYRYGPDRDKAQWTWLTPGSLAAALGIGLLTVGFSIYVANFGNYNATYGSLGAVVVLLTWLYLSALVLLLGAELNSELEHQTARDTTQGPERPLGQRGAEMADRVAPSPGKEDQHGQAKRRDERTAAG